MKGSSFIAIAEFDGKGRCIADSGSLSLRHFVAHDGKRLKGNTWSAWVPECDSWVDQTRA
jgi:hypothetical protein